MVLSELAAVGMAVGPPLVYSDQLLSILKRKDSTGFSIDVCGVLLCANIIRIFFWFGKRFELALLVQSLLMIAFQLVLLYFCLKYSKAPLPLTNDADPSPAVSGTGLLSGVLSKSANGLRPYDLWQWPSYGTYIEFLAGLIVLNTFIYLFFSGYPTYVDTIGLVALGLESTLPIPQLLSNYRRKSLAGFRMTVLAGWLLGDAFKTLYFFFQAGNSWQFKATACFQLSIDFLILGQARIYRANTARGQHETLASDIESVPLDRSPRASIDRA